MARLKLGPILNEKPVKVSVELPAQVHRDLIAYAEVLARQTGQPVDDPTKLIAPMVEHFIATDREFARVRRGEDRQPHRSTAQPTPSS
ncbi:DUF2274 domain-containing protein [Ancylobacter polymorphus]|uniref:DUF2274 domain-containing protein n=1 Tax=Ancylobacter polymorphus TaxID=223390 RepID=A0A9E7CYB0_9HYPH|nr:DUF2274 domain-containing protein [Ancylobacter polymorphus]UOK73329.1 DUF2274 domain-containing protein [Ancylobacter polymorphus]